VRKTVLATAISVALTLSAADAFAQSKGAATKAEVQAVQAQMQALADRLSRLEATNAALQSENAELKALVDRRDAETDYLKAQTKDLREEAAVASGEIAKVKGADWATKIKFRGDLRFRDENFDMERAVSGEAVDAADRNRARIRARFGADIAVTDTVKATVALATGADDPRSSNQTLTGEATRKEFRLDLAYVDWRFMNGGNLVLGKQKYPFWRPTQSLFYDGDFNPEGAAATFDRGMLFGNAYAWWLEERFNADPNGQNADTLLYGAQLGLKFPLFGGETRVAAHYYDLGGGQFSNPFYANSSNGNTTILEGTTPVLAFDYDVVELSGEINATVFNLPLAVFAQYAENQDPDDLNTAYAVGAMLGKASNPRTWEFGAMYESMEKDALFAQMIDSDFGDGRTDAEGWVLKAGYAPVRNVTLNGTYFINTLNKDVGTELDYNRLQLDVNYKF
jgi:hypothetical protein